MRTAEDLAWCARWKVCDEPRKAAKGAAEWSRNGSGTVVEACRGGAPIDGLPPAGTVVSGALDPEGRAQAGAL